MNRLTSARNFVAFTLAVRKYAQTRGLADLSKAEGTIKARLQTREERFLELADRAIFENRNSPYLPLLKAAGCEKGDLHTLVLEEGLEPALRRLRDEGVYFSFEEFKGRRPVERPGVSFEARSDDFDNPTIARQFSATSGGSPGRQTRVWMNLQSPEWDVHRPVTDAAHGLHGAPSTVWGTSELASFVYGLILQRNLTEPGRWFSTRNDRGGREAARYAVGTKLIALAARAGGLRLQKREWVDPSDPSPIVRWAEEQIRAHGRCRIMATISRGVRIALAASEGGIDLTGASIVGGGEPATPGKARAIARSGAKWIPFYIFVEGGQVGFGCANPVDESDVHLLSDRLGLIQTPRKIPGTDLTVDAFNFTTLSANSPKILLNVEVDDFGVLERRRCGCALEEIGYDQHIREIYSFQKLTGEGVTLVGSDMIRILEEVLPERFGGSPLDYQLVEEEDDQDLTRLSLLIDPRVRIEDESQVISTVLNELKATDAPSSMAGTIWAQAGTFRIKRTQPLTTPVRGKLMPLHVSRKSTTSP